LAIFTAKNMSPEIQEEEGEQFGSYRVPLPRRNNSVSEQHD
jgi:hypothetical protein